MLEQSDSCMSGVYSKHEDFCVDNVNLPIESTSKSCDNDAVGHSVNLISPVIPNSDVLVEMVGCKDE